MKDQVIFNQAEEQRTTTAPALNQIWSALSTDLRTSVIRLLVDLALKLVLSQRQSQANLTQAQSQEGEVRQLC